MVDFEKLKISGLKLNGIHKWSAILARICLILVLPLSATAAVAQGAGAVIPMQTQTGNVPFLADALKDPAMVKKALRDDFDADRMRAELQPLPGDLSRSQGIRRLEILRNLTEGHILLAMYYQDSLDGRLANSAQDAAQNLAQSRRELARFVAMYIKEEKNQGRRAAIAYHGLVQQYLAGQNRANVARQLGQLEHLNSLLNRRRDFLMAYHNLQFGNANAASAKAMLGLIGQLPADGAIAARLVAARQLAGVNRSGRQTGKANPQYRALLAQSVQRSQRFGENMQRATLAFATGVWVAAEGNSIDWNRPPFNMKLIENESMAHAIIERSAIQDASKGQAQRAIRKYDGLANVYAGSSLALSLDTRKLNLAEQIYRKDSNPSLYERQIIAAKEKYQNDHTLGQGQERTVVQTRERLEQRHLALLTREITQAKGKNATAPQRAKTIELIQTYLRIQLETPRREAFMAEIAAIHALNGNHREAVAIYMDLGINGEEANKTRHLNLAISSQRVLASWPASAPWAAIPQGPATERARLTEIYQALNERGSGHWPIIAHIGLLQISLQQEDAAFSLWRTAIDAQAGHADANHAAGFMLVRYEQSKRWGDLEAVARVAIAKQMRPIFRQQAVSPVAALGNSLFFGGKQALAESQFAVAVEKLKEFTASFRQDRRRDDGLFHLGLAQHGNAEYPAAVGTMTNLVEEYPRTGFMANALYLGGKWANESAMEEQSIFFAQRFVNGFSHDDRYPEVRDQLLALYFGRELFAPAGGLLKNEAESRRNDQATRLQFALQWLKLEERYGSPARVRTASQLVQQLSAGQDDARALALGAELRSVAKQQRFGEVQTILSALRRLNTNSPLAQEAIGEGLFVLAEAEAAKWTPEVFNLGLKDPMAAMNQQYTIYNRIRGHYERVCSEVPSSWCGPAQFQAARLTESAFSVFEEYQMPETLAKADVDAFNQRKEAILLGMSSIMMQAENKALAEIQGGQSLPAWTQQVLWIHSNDWNFQQLTDDTGQGYLQWSPAND